MRSFNHRSNEVELMDDLLCDGAVVAQTLRELEIINSLLGGNSVTLSGVKELLTKQNGDLSIADLGCGGGDILRLLAEWGRKKGLRLTLTGIDANPHIIAFATQRSVDYRNINYSPINIFSKEFQQLSFDVITATLFTHHFSDVEIIDLLKSLKKTTRIGIVINDIHRNWFAYYSIRALTAWFSKSTMVKFDAPLSVLRSFKRKEIVSILESAEITDYSLTWKWAFRWRLIISTHGS
jgi:2-polyprenyl-3-methyl-5-hydroxy-6-metoxy-1,4-benzoquinol methylase